MILQHIAGYKLQVGVKFENMVYSITANMIHGKKTMIIIFHFDLRENLKVFFKQ